MPLKPVPEGWYLVYWRAISVDGHPVRGAFTFAVGPEPGSGAAVRDPVDLGDGRDAAPARRALGRLPLGDGRRRAGGAATRDRAAGRSPRRAARACVPSPSRSSSARRSRSSSIPVYLLLATADFALRSVAAVGALVPLVRVSAFGRGYVDLWIVFALFVAAAALAIRIDRPERDQRSLAELLAGIGVVLAAGAALLVPGTSGHAAQTAPRGWSLRLRLAASRRRIDLDRRSRRPARALARAACGIAARGARRRGAALLERVPFVSVVTLVRLGDARVVRALADARLALADVVRARPCS